MDLRYNFQILLPESKILIPESESESESPFQIWAGIGIGIGIAILESVRNRNRNRVSSAGIVPSLVVVLF